jgi:hypothetical protein
MSHSDPEDGSSVTSLAGPSVVRERASDIKPGDVIAGRYQVEAIIGKGGSGIVLRAFDRTAQMPVALKVLRPDLAADQRWSQRFARELRLGRPIRHPNVCRIFDIGEADGHKFLTMELAADGTLRDLIKKNEPQRPLSERLADAEAAIAGLAAIHEAGIVHRDVKPDNMLRMADGRLALSDFGLATDLSNTGPVTVMVGTPHYMAPEIRAGEPATARCDVWSLGVVLYEIFFGLRPERKSSKSQAGMSKPPPPLTATPTERALLALVERCLEESPFDRPENAQEVLRLFVRIREAPESFRRRRGRLAVVASVGLGLVAAASTWVLRVRHAAVPEAPGRPIATGVPTVDPSGMPADWGRTATRLATFAGQFECLALLNETTARVVWGQPRRAEDIDLETGARRASPIVAETYAAGCPQMSPLGQGILYMGVSTTGAKEIRLSRRADGREAQPITAGEDPVWMKTGDDFLYNLDASHVAVFALPTMSHTLLQDPGLGGHQTVFDKAASFKSDAVAVLNITNRSTWALTVYDGEALEHHRTVEVPSARSIAFDRRDEVLLTDNRSAAFSTATSLSWRTMKSRHLGRLPGLEIVNVTGLGDGYLVVARRRSKDVWVFRDGQQRRLTFDGDNYAVARAGSGTLLLTKRSPDGSFSIWLRNANGALSRLTKGPNDNAPAASPDGHTWAYADHERGAVVVCASTAASTCRTLRTEDLLPIWLRFSPDGKRLAYVTQAKSPQLVVVSVGDGSARRVASAHRECPPLWATDGTIWNLEATEGRNVWTERNVDTGGKTGQRLDVRTSLADGDCRPADGRYDSAVFREPRIDSEETAVLLRIRGAEPRLGER